MRRSVYYRPYVRTEPTYAESVPYLIRIRDKQKLLRVEAFYTLYNLDRAGRCTTDVLRKTIDRGTGVDSRINPTTVIIKRFGKKKQRYLKSVKRLNKSLIKALTDIFAVLSPIKLKKEIGHPYHLVTPSALPFTLSLAFLCVFQNFLGFMWFEGWHYITIYFFHAVFFANFFAVILTWILEVFKEEQSGAHTVEIQKGFQYGILLFILSELMLFFSFFWAYFHFTLNSSSFTGGTFIPEGVVAFFWYRIPLLNTLLLLASGLSLTIGHILLVEQDKVYRLRLWTNLIISMYSRVIIEASYRTIKASGLSQLVSKINKGTYWNGYSEVVFKWTSYVDGVRCALNPGLTVLPKIATLQHKNLKEMVVFSPTFWVLDTVLKGFVFLMYQAYEYTSSMFAINDSVYGAVFFSLTGLHGLHVFVGVMFLFTFVIVNLAREYSISCFKRRRWNLHPVLRFKHTVFRFVQRSSSYNLKQFNHRVAFDGAAWYWHFVDVVWLFVFIFVYWWGFAE